MSHAPTLKLSGSDGICLIFMIVLAKEGINGPYQPMEKENALFLVSPAVLRTRSFEDLYLSCLG